MPILASIFETILLQEHTYDPHILEFSVPPTHHAICGIYAVYY